MRHSLISHEQYRMCVCGSGCVGDSVFVGGSVGVRGACLCVIMGLAYSSCHFPLAPHITAVVIFPTREHPHGYPMTSS